MPMENRYPTYNPNDIESLLNAKSFEELSESERNFALENVSSAAEYNDIRNTLLNVKSSFVLEEELLPENSIHESLLEQFNKMHKPAPSALQKLKQALFPSGKNILFAPGFQLAGVAIIIVAVGIVVSNQTTETTSKELAINKTQPTFTDTIKASDDLIRERNATAENPEIANSSTTEPVELNTVTPVLGEVVADEMTIAEEELKKEGPTDKSVFAKEKEIIATDNNTVVSGNTFSSPKKDNYNSVTLNTEDDRVLNENTKSDKRAEVAKNKTEVTTSKKKTKNEDVVSPAVNAGSSVSLDDVKGTVNKETIGVSLGEKPELIELLFTTL